jgi:hypothetical protein
MRIELFFWEKGGIVGIRHQEANLLKPTKETRLPENNIYFHLIKLPIY